MIENKIRCYKIKYRSNANSLLSSPLKYATIVIYVNSENRTRNSKCSNRTDDSSVARKSKLKPNLIKDRKKSFKPLESIFLERIVTFFPRSASATCCSLSFVNIVFRHRPSPNEHYEYPPISKGLTVAAKRPGVTRRGVFPV